MSLKGAWRFVWRSRGFSPAADSGRGPAPRVGAALAPTGRGRWVCLPPEAPDAAQGALLVVVAPAAARRRVGRLTAVLAAADSEWCPALLCQRRAHPDGTRSVGPVVTTWPRTRHKRDRGPPESERATRRPARVPARRTVANAELNACPHRPNKSAAGDRRAGSPVARGHALGRRAGA
jgi:hypothetical protein